MDKISVGNPQGSRQTNKQTAKKSCSIPVFFKKTGMGDSKSTIFGQEHLCIEDFLQEIKLGAWLPRLRLSHCLP